MRKVIITGILGQDGSNLAEYLLNTFDDILIFGVYKRGSNPNKNNITTISGNNRFNLISADITDQTSMDNLVKTIQPDYFVNLAANSFVGTSWDTPEQVFNVNTLGVLKCLEAIRKFSSPNRPCKFYSAGSSEEFGETLYVPQDDKHPLIPVSPYAVAKTAARHIVDVYRRSYKLFAVHATLYNHEGPKRGTEFVTRKITMNIAKQYIDFKNTGTLNPFFLGNIYSNKDWTDSRDMVKGIWLMLEKDVPKDYILASGKTRTVKDFIKEAYNSINYDVEWQGSDINEIALIKPANCDKSFVGIKIDAKLFRPTETGIQCGDASKAQTELNWIREISFEKMVSDMVTNDINLIRQS